MSWHDGLSVEIEHMFTVLDGSDPIGPRRREIEKWAASKRARSAARGRESYWRHKSDPDWQAARRAYRRNHPRKFTPRNEVQRRAKSVYMRQRWRSIKADSQVLAKRREIQREEWARRASRRNAARRRARALARTQP